MQQPMRKTPMSITSPSTDGTVGTSFTATGTCSDVVSSTDHPTMTAKININGTDYDGTMSYPEAGKWSASFSNLPTGSGATLTVTCSAMSGNDPQVTNLTVSSQGGSTAQAA